MLQHERAAAVREAIAKLPPKQRATLMLRIYQECSHEEIAAALGGTVGAAKANLFHALGNLRRALSTDMTNHLRPDEFVDAMDGALSTARGAHLEHCAECRAELDGLLSMQREARADDAPEPSPLFWDHFSARVREATARESSTPAPWWRTGWQPIAALTVAAAAVVLVLQMRSTPAVVRARSGARHVQWQTAGARRRRILGHRDGPGVGDRVG